MIDEKRLIEELRKSNYHHASNSREKALLDRTIRIVQEQPKVNEWIPIEEKLPKPSLNSVIGYDELRERCVFVQYYNNRWILGNDEPVKIIAWQPLPNPYVKEK